MRRWVVGWSVGAVVIAIAAALLVAIIVLCRRIVSQADDITRALDGARERTAALFALTEVNDNLRHITRDLRTVREGIDGG